MTVVARSSNSKSFLAATRAGLMKSTALVAVALAASMTLAPIDTSAQQAWDGASPGDNAAAGGAGTWDGSGGGAANWVNGGASSTYTPNVDTTFGTVGGAISVTNGAAVTDMTFDAGGYVLSGANLNALNGTRTITVTNGADTATISNTWLQNGGASDVFKAGAGTLVIGGNMSTLGGTTTVSAGTLSVAVGGSLNTSDVKYQYWRYAGFTKYGLIGQRYWCYRGSNVNVSVGLATVTGGTFGFGQFAKTGAGTLVLSGGGIHTGGTAINAGTLTTNNVAALGTGTVTVNVVRLI